MMQADLVLYLRSELHRQESLWSWWPETLLYADRFGGAFEVFARSRSTAYFNRARVILGIETKKPLQTLLEKYNANPSQLPGWGFGKLNVGALAGIDQIATKP